MINFFKKYHKWLGIIFSLFILFFALSGIVLNHRKLFSAVDINRNILPDDYSYHHWNNAAVKGSEKISNDSIFIYGNIGIWLTDSSFSYFTDFNSGFPDGIDNRKIEKLYYGKDHQLYAGTLFGLFKYKRVQHTWEKCPLPGNEERITDIENKGDSLLVMTRSFLYTTTDAVNFNRIHIHAPNDYDNKAALFKTLWIIHSGEIWGVPGILLVDLTGLIFIFLSITGLVYFILAFVYRKKKKNLQETVTIIRIRRWSLKWHNKIGWLTLLLLIIISATGMFLRPPLLALIADAKVAKIPFTELDTPNPWFDKLRRIIYDDEQDIYLLATLDGVYVSKDLSGDRFRKIKNQPPISVMGVNVFDKLDRNTLLVGSFEGLFKWNINNGTIEDYIKKQPPKLKPRGGPPLGEFLVTAYSPHFMGEEVFFDFNSGAHCIGSKKAFPTMPVQIKEQAISLWNVSLEVHTARMYRIIFGRFYILFIPLAGLLILFVLLSGFIVWWKRY